MCTKQSTAKSREAEGTRTKRSSYDVFFEPVQSYFFLASFLEVPVMCPYGARHAPVVEFSQMFDF